MGFIAPRDFPRQMDQNIEKILASRGPVDVLKDQIHGLQLSGLLMQSTIDLDKPTTLLGFLLQEEIVDKKRPLPHDPFKRHGELI